MKKQTAIAKKDLEEQKKIAKEAKEQAELMDYQRRRELMKDAMEGLKKLGIPTY